MEHGHLVSRPEFSRPVEVIGDVATKETRPSKAGTHTLDGAWGKCKAGLPRNSGARTERQFERLELQVRAMQWRRMTSGLDPWVCFCEAAQLWMRGQPKPVADQKAVHHADGPGLPSVFDEEHAEETHADLGEPEPDAQLQNQTIPDTAESEFRQLCVRAWGTVSSRCRIHSAQLVGSIA